jgi:predicted ATPase
MAFKFLEGLRCLNRRVLALLNANAWGCFHRRNKRAATNMPSTRHLQIIVSEKLMSKMIDTYRYHSIVFMYRTVTAIQAEDGQRGTDDGGRSPTA